MIKEQFGKFNDVICEFKKSLSFFNEKYEEMRTALEEKSTTIQKLMRENCSLTKSISDITKRMNILEQHARSNNVEIQCIPEHPSENLINTVLQLGKVIKCDIKDTDIQLTTRIAKKDANNKRPKSVLVKFTSPRVRDTFLAASLHFNKNNPKSKLNSSHLGIANDKPVPIYVVEHLSPENKALHAATRVRAKELGYRFVWVRNGRIFIKKDENSQTVVIGDVEKLKDLS